MENINRIMHEIEGLSFPEKMKLTIKIMETYLNDMDQKISMKEPGYTSENMNLPLNRALDEIIIKKNEGFIRDEEISTGFSTLDQYTQGFLKGSLSIIGGRPAMGKTTFLLNLARNMLYDEQRVGFVSLEINPVRLTKQLLYLYAGVYPSDKPEKNEKEKLKQAKAALENKPVFHQSFKNIFPGVAEVIKACRNMLEIKQVEIIFIDYLQLIDKGFIINSEYENADSSYVITELKRFAREYHIPLVITSGLTRDVALRSGDKRPIISDLAGSDFIDELADNILLLHRPAYYGIIEDEEGTDLTNITEVIIAKSRDGTPGEIYLKKRPDSLILEER